jgi:hypothetical protein
MEREESVLSPGIEAQLPCHLASSLVTVLKPTKQHAPGHIPGHSAVPASCGMETLQM